MAKKIPDISHHHPVQDWTQVMGNAGVLISKATQGTGYTDPTLDSFIKNCEKNKIPYWLYTFLVKGSGADQAKYMVDRCKGKVGKYFVGYIVDAEKNPSTGTKPTDSQVRAALDYLATLGIKWGLYTGFADYAYYKSSITKAKNSDGGFWWEARYGNNNGAYSSKYPCNKGASLHQFTSLGTCPGISGRIDLNRVTGKGKTLEWFMTPAEKKTETKPPAVNTLATERTITICGHGFGRPSTKVMHTYLETRYKSKAPNGKRKGVVKVMRLKALTDAGRTGFHGYYEIILGRNYYSQGKREYVFRKAADGRYYSDCSSSGMAALQRCGYGVTLLNTAGIYQSSLFKEVPVEIKNGHIINPELLKVGDALLFVGNDPKRPLQIGHVEWVYEIRGGTKESTPEKKQETEKKSGGTYNVEFVLLKAGTKSKQVNTFELCMKAKGYYTGKIDGVYGPKCEEACKKLQKAKMGQKETDGKCGEKTWPYVLGLK